MEFTQIAHRRRRHTYKLHHAVGILYEYKTLIDPRQNDESIEMFLDRNNRYFDQVVELVYDPSLNYDKLTRDQMIAVITAAAVIDPTGPYAEGGVCDPATTSKMRLAGEQRAYQGEIYFCVMCLYFFQTAVEPRQKGESVETFVGRNQSIFDQSAYGVDDKDRSIRLNREQLGLTITACAILDPEGPYAEGGIGIQIGPNQR
jgi:hypothetical protein